MKHTAPPENAHPVDVMVGAKVRDLRIHRGYNQSDLGRALGLTFQQVQKYERAANRISASKLQTIATFLEVPVAYFFEPAPEGQELPTTAISPRLIRAINTMRPDGIPLLADVAEIMAKALPKETTECPS